MRRSARWFWRRPTRGAPWSVAAAAPPFPYPMLPPSAHPPRDIARILAGRAWTPDVHFDTGGAPACCALLGCPRPGLVVVREDHQTFDPGQHWQRGKVARVDGTPNRHVSVGCAQRRLDAFRDRQAGAHRFIGPEPDYATALAMPYQE